MNMNCLEGIKCPGCGQTDEFLVYASMWVSLTDDGTDPHADSVDNMGGTEYDENSPTRCPKCDYEGELGEFDLRIPKVTPEQTIATAEAEDAEYPLSDWQYEVSNGDTYRGYLEWVAACRMRDRPNDEEECP